MSRLLVVVRPALVPGFHLAGVEAFPADDVEEAQSLIGQWLEAGETGLIAIDDELLSSFEATFQRKLEAAEELPYLAIPSGEPRGPAEARRRRVSELIRRAIGFRITFKGEQSNG
jgi:V/A-type H+/Na+-transporting ATPase subunit F